MINPNNCSPLSVLALQSARMEDARRLLRETIRALRNMAAELLRRADVLEGLVDQAHGAEPPDLQSAQVVLTGAQAVADLVSYIKNWRYAGGESPSVK